MKVLALTSSFELTLARLELLRRKYFVSKKGDPAPYIAFQSVDIILLSELYPEQFPPQILLDLRELSSQDVQNLKERVIPMEVGSILLTNHMQVEELRKGFSDALQSEKKLLKHNLLEHLDTLLFVCLWFYNSQWDVNRLSFDSEVAHKSFGELKYEDQPYYYRSRSIMQQLSSLAYQFYRAKDTSNAVNSITFTINNIPVTLDDKALVRWITKEVLGKLKNDEYPLSFGGDTLLLANLVRAIESKGLPPGTDQLASLEKLRRIEPLNYVGDKNKQIKQFVESIHKSFCHVMDLPISSYRNEQLRLYNQILKLFKIEDFSVNKRSYTRPHGTEAPKYQYVIERNIRSILK